MFTLPVQSKVKVHIFFACICSSQILLSVLKACHFSVLRVSSFVREPFTCGALVATS